MQSYRLGEVGRDWFAVQVWAGREQLALRHLQVRGYDVFLPSYLERRRWSDRTKQIERALFSGYAFCRLDANMAGKIITTPGVVRIVGDAHGPIAVAPDEIAAIQRIVASRLLVEPWPMLREGQTVRIEAGPLAGVEGTVIAVKNRQRLVVSVGLLQRAVAVELDVESVGLPAAMIVNQDAARAAARA
jgi:transcription antitermination factor NusG